MQSLSTVYLLIAILSKAEPSLTAATLGLLVNKVA